VHGCEVLDLVDKLLGFKNYPLYLVGKVLGSKTLSTKFSGEDSEFPEV